ncbi:MAG: hypothetical protein IPG83_02290 [Novosphingobium sp.]|nr:hypothetical protein [Novosphingobium sp.]
MRLKAAITGIALAAASPALAGPTYLVCTLTPDDKPSAINLTADESNSIVTVSAPSGRSRAPTRLAASFTAGQVTFGDGMVNYRLDRSTLSIVREMPRFGFVERGTCQIEKAEKRAF